MCRWKSIASLAGCLAFVFFLLDGQAGYGQCLSGTYTIGGTSPNYANFTAAAADLNQKGVCGPVVFQVRAVTFTDRLVLNQITGASATNTITFVGDSKTGSNLGYAGTAVTDAPVVVLNGADYVTIKDMTIECRSTNATGYGVGVLFTNLADHNTIKNCNIKMLATATGGSWYGITGSATASSVAVAGDYGNYNVIDGNTITGGYQAIHLEGASTSNYTEGTEIRNNLIDNWYRYGIYTYYQDGLVIEGNTINLPRSTIGDAMYHYYASNFRIANNYSHGDDYGLYMYYPNANFAGTSPSVIVNNMIVSENSYGLNIGTGAKNINIYHNSIHSQSGTTQTVNFVAGTNIDFRNNIVVKSGGGTNVAFQVASGVSFSYLDYNLFYAPGSTAPFSYNGITYQKLQDLQAAVPAYNQHSVYADPGFVSATDLHLFSASVPRPFGMSVGVTEDKDKDARCVSLPTIGADESLFGKTGHLSVGIIAPDTVFVSSPAEVVAKLPATQAQTISWYLDNKLLGTANSIDLVAPSTGNHELKLIAQNCDTKDSAVKTIVIVTPSKAPEVQFLSNNNFIKQGQSVQFTELTNGGATGLRWDVSPGAAFVNGNKVATYTYMQGDTFSRSPIIRFNVGGAYRICLTATNSQGSTSLCKDAYIKVTTSYNLKGSMTAQDTAGYIYDDGGPDNNYSNSTTGNLLITPCADKIYLVVKNLDLECGYDYLRIYDGVNNKGKALFTCPSSNGFTGYTGSTCTNTCLPSPTDTFVASSGSLYVEFSTDGSGIRTGFEAYWWSKRKNVPKPVADFTLPDSVCSESLASFVSKSQGDNLKYLWDLDADPSTFEAATANTSYGYFQPGLVDITLIVSNCGGSDTMTKSLKVYNPVAPATSFTADNLNPTINDIVFFSTSMPMCVTEYRWRFTPSAGNGTAKFMNGTSKNSAAPQVTFSDTGCYSVFLYTKNVSGEDSLELQCFVHVKSPYCVPSVTTMIPDIGISSVTLHTLKSTSSQGINQYENFTSTRSVTLETGVTYSLTVGRNTNVNEVTRTAWIDWNHDGDFADAGEKIGEQKNSIAKDWTTSFMVPTSTLTGATVLRIAINHGGRTNDPCGPNRYGEYEDYRVYITPDLTAPVITLLGNDTVFVEQGYTYTEAGATAKDNLDGDITANIKKTVTPTFDNMVPNDYFVHFNVKDAAGNPAKEVIRVIRVTADKTPPALIVTGSDTIYVAVGDKTYTDPIAVSAEDLVDADLLNDVVKAGSADPMNVGVYTITYTVQDLLGNTAVVKRVIIVRDLVAPVITLNGSDTVYQEVGAAYNDAGVSVSDNYYTGLESKVITTGNIDITKVGTYTLVYNVTDGSGNKAVPVSRTVIVRDTKAPSVTLNGKAAEKLEVNTGIAYADPGVVVTDNSNAAKLVVTGSYYATFPDGKPTQLGDYTIVYTATDSSGNTTSVTRDIKVVDETAPVITLKGRPGVNVCRWAVYNDAGYTLSDNYYDTSDITVTIDGDLVSTQEEGIYNFRYMAVDGSGNTSYSDWRIVNVKPAGEAGCMTGINALGSLDKSINVYPNPNNGKFNVSILLPASEKVSIRVVNALGAVVQTVNEGTLGNGIFSIDLSGQASGVYLLQVTAGDKSTIKRVIVNR
jgi:PKD repeat protein